MLSDEDKQRLQERIRQEKDLAAQRPVAPADPAPLMSGGAGAAPDSSGGTAYRAPRGLKQFLRDIPVLGDVLAALNRLRRRRNTGLRVILRRTPLLGGVLAWLNGLRYLAGTRRLVAEIDARQGMLIALQSAQAVQLADIGRQLEQTARQLEQTARQLEQTARHLTARDAEHASQFQDVARHLANHDRALIDYGALLRAHGERHDVHQRDLDAQREELAEFIRRADRQRGELQLLQRRLSRLGDVAPAGGAPSAPPVSAAEGLDAYYLAFEDNFRGSRTDIKQRLSVYLDRLSAAGLATMGKPVLDIGCGRGEWLELLGENGYAAYGVDLNALNAERCTEAGLDVRHGDALAHLRGLPDGSLAAVTAFHLIEHLPFALLIELVEEANRVLASGGVILFETPNPANIQVGACTFYNDPTHLNPIPAGVTHFLLENRGFVRVEVMFLHPFAEQDQLAAESELARRFNAFFYGPQDYGVIGHRL